MGMMKNTSPASTRPHANPSNPIPSPSSIMSRMNAANAANAANPVKTTNLPHPVISRCSIPESSSSSTTTTTTPSSSSIPTPALRHPSQEGGKGTTIGEIRRSHQNQGNEVTKAGSRPSSVVMSRLSHESHDLEEVIKRLDAMEQRMQQLDSISDQLNTLMMAVNRLSRQLQG